MPADRFGFLKNRRGRILTAALAAQAALYYASARSDQVPLLRPLRDLPAVLGPYRMVQESPIEPQVQDQLRADDTLSRQYAGPDASPSLFVAYYKSQRTGRAPHSPKNCMPGSGWTPSVSDVIFIPIRGRPEPIEANRYVVSLGEESSLVLYWYQSRDRVVASEYKAKLYVALDAFRYNRSDTAVVRVVVPIAGKRADAATQAAVRFVQELFFKLRQLLPA